MADDLNVILKAQLDINETTKQVNIQLEQLEEKIKSLGININMDGVFKSFNTSFGKVKESVDQIAKSFGNISIGNNFSKGFDELNSRVNEVRANVDSLAKVKIGLSVGEDGTSRIENALLTYKNGMGQVINETMEWKNVLDNVGNITGQTFRSSFENISDDISVANKQADSFDNYINTARRSVELLEDKIANLGTTKGLDVTKYSENITAIKTQLATLGQGGEVSDLEIQKKTLNDMLLSTNDLINTDTKHLTILNQKEALYAKIDENIQKLNSIQNEYSGADTAKIKATKESLDKLKTSVQNNSTSVNKANTENKQFSNSIKNISTEAKSASAATSTWASRLERVFQFTMFYQGINLVKQGIREMISTVTQLNTAMSNIQMVTGGTTKQTEELMLSYNKLGRELGATTLEVSTSANEFLRQGKTVEETNTLIKNAMILSKIGMISSAEATSYLTSSMKGFNVEASASLDIIDKLSAVDVISATSAGGIAEAMSRTASSAKLAGIEVDRLIGYLALVGEVTQKDMSSIGESFKTIFSRMGNVKLGQFTDEDGNDITTQINDVEKVLEKVDIKLRSSATEFRDFGLVLDDVGNNWGSFNEVEQNAIATTFAGKQMSYA